MTGQENCQGENRMLKGHQGQPRIGSTSKTLGLIIASKFGVKGGVVVEGSKSF